MVHAPAEGVAVDLRTEPLHLLLELGDPLVLPLDLGPGVPDVGVAREEVGEGRNLGVNREIVNISTQESIHRITLLAASTRLAMSWHSVKVTECLPSRAAALNISESVRSTRMSSLDLLVLFLGETETSY